jgi:hypothetical protein
VKKRSYNQSLRQSKVNQSNHLKPIQRRVEKLVDEEKKEKICFDAQYQDMSHMERVDRALDLYFVDHNVHQDKEDNLAIKKIAVTFGLEWKALKQYVEFSTRDALFFDHFSLDYCIDELTDFQYKPMK